ncbi:MAG: hypothetical protein EZS28_042208 [Streblomastix strix]|uniref:Uncharacterized protein n=1 Tax=Streblomastix strix TaxID=222440 RepID=A0A5J4TXY7_9EUKA|nr:MAG: hypothetical protein EZS28_042208 [Streblomastix strix]
MKKYLLLGRIMQINSIIGTVAVFVDDEKSGQSKKDEFYNIQCGNFFLFNNEYLSEGENCILSELRLLDYETTDERSKVLPYAMATDV